MKEKLVYNSSTERLEVLNYDTNKVKDFLTGSEREVSGTDYFYYINDSEKLYQSLTDDTNPSEPGIKSMIEPIKGQLLLAVLVIAISIIAIYKSCVGGSQVNEYPAYTYTDTLPATRDDVKDFIREYEVRTENAITQWRKELIMNSVVGVKKTRAHYMVDSIANEQKSKYKK